MGSNSKIGWTDHTFNPWVGCTKVSAGCKNCYAETLMDKRYHRVNWGAGQPRARTSAANWRSPQYWNREALARHRSFKIFSGSLCDWLDAEVPVEWLADFLGLIASNTALTWLLLSKRPELWRERMEAARNELLRREDAASQRALAMVQGWLAGQAPWHIWFGISAERQQELRSRMQSAKEIPAAAVRFVSAEPLLGDIAIREFREHINWVIIGGESGEHRREMSMEHFRSTANECLACDIPLFVKQDSGKREGEQGRIPNSYWRLKQFPTA